MIAEAGNARLLSQCLTGLPGVGDGTQVYLRLELDDIVMLATHGAGTNESDGERHCKEPFLELSSLVS